VNSSSLIIAFCLAIPCTAEATDGPQVPLGAKLVLTLTADGVQVYSCEAETGGFAFVFKGPEAALFDAKDRQIGTHGKGPVWTLSDGSSVTGEVVTSEPSPQKGNIAHLLLAVKSHMGSGRLSNVVSIRRIDTKGGVAPQDGCDAAHEGEVARMRYSATYQFFAK
jgi:hypothetical protein